MLPTTVIVASLLSLFTSTVVAQCKSQSCWIANLSGSTGETYELKNGKRPDGGNARGDKCIRENLAKLGMPTPPGMRGRSVAPKEEEEKAADYFDLEKRAECKEYSILFAPGTLEASAPGLLGRPLVSGLGSGWYSEPISYSNTMAGIDCIGMPGGILAKSMVEKLVARCPNTKIVLGGYSQGAMVVRIAAAYVAPEIQKKIVAIVTFGDPFNGAPVKGIPNENIKVYCASADGVCNGKLDVNVAHLSYGGGEVTKATEWVKTVVKKAA